MYSGIKVRLNRDGFTFSSCECKGLLVFLRSSCHGILGHFSEVAGEADHDEVFLNVVHDLGLQENLSEKMNIFSKVDFKSFANVFLLEQRRP